MYQQMIITVLQGLDLEADPRHVEAWMRLERGNLDGLSRGRFRLEVELSVACIQQAGLVESEELAESFGLLRSAS